MPDIKELHLNVEKDDKVKIYTDEFAKKALGRSSAGNLSQEETAWGAKCIDDMIKGLYTEEELAKFKEAGIDPAAGILINGHPANLYSMGNTYTTVFSDPAKNGVGKCRVLAEALDGSEIDVIKYGIDEKGKITPKETVPVTTTVKKVSEKRTNWFRRLLESIGLATPKINKKLEKTNKKPRDRSNIFKSDTLEQNERDRFKNEMSAAKEKIAQNQLDNINVKIPENSQSLSVAQRQAITTQLRGESVKLNKLRAQMDIDFFGDQFKQEEGKTHEQSISNNIRNKFKLTCTARNDFHAITVMEAYSRRVHMAILYGMSQGHSFDEITAPENGELRKKIGKEFVENMSTMTLSEFAEKNGLENNINNPQTKQKYEQYFLEQTAKLEKFYCKCCDAVRGEHINFPDPNNYNEIISTFGRNELLGSLTQDLTQSSQWITSPHYAFDQNSPAAVDANKRVKAVMDYVKVDVGVLTAANQNASKYISFIASNDFAKEGAFFNSNNQAINQAAKGKVALQFYHDNTKDMDCMARFIDNEDLAKKIVSFRSEPGSAFDDSKLASAAYNNFLRTNDPEMKNAVYDENKNEIVFFSSVNPNGKSVNLTDASAYEKDAAQAKADLKTYINYINVHKELGQSLTEAYENGVLEHPISEAEKAAKTIDESERAKERAAAIAAEKAAQAEREAKRAAESRPLTEAEKAAQEKENYITGAMKDGISRENAELLWKTEQHDKKVAQEIDGVMKEAENLQTETRTKITRDEFMGNTNQKKTMPPKETQAPTKQMDMSKP